MLPGDRLVCAFVEPQAVGLRFEKWLLHVTILPWFRLPDSSESIAKGLGRALSNIAPFEAKTAEQALFGPRKNRPAVLLEPIVPLEAVEAKVRSYLYKKRAWLVDETTKHPRQFRPHITVQGRQTLQLGRSFYCDKVYIVEQRGGYKEIVGVILLANL